MRLLHRHRCRRKRHGFAQRRHGPLQHRHRLPRNRRLRLLHRHLCRRKRHAFVRLRWGPLRWRSRLPARPGPGLRSGAHRCRGRRSNRRRPTETPRRSRRRPLARPKALARPRLQLPTPSSRQVRRADEPGARRPNRRTARKPRRRSQQPNSRTRLRRSQPGALERGRRLSRRTEPTRKSRPRRPRPRRRAALPRAPGPLEARPREPQARAVPTVSELTTGAAPVRRRLPPPRPRLPALASARPPPEHSPTPSRGTFAGRGRFGHPPGRNALGYGPCDGARRDKARPRRVAGRARVSRTQTRSVYRESWPCRQPLDLWCAPQRPAASI